MFFFSLFLHTLVCFGKFFYGEYGNRVDDETDNSVNDRDGSPARSAAAEPSYSVDRNCFNEDLSCECKDKAEGAKLNSFTCVFGDQRGERCVCNIICGKEYILFFNKLI